MYKITYIYISHKKMLAVGDFGNYLPSKNTEPKPRSHVDPSSELNTVERTEVTDKKAAATKKVSPQLNATKTTYTQSITRYLNPS